MKKYFYKKEIEMIKEYKDFNIALIREVNTENEYYIDVDLISFKPYCESIINIDMLAGGK